MNKMKKFIKKYYKIFIGITIIKYTIILVLLLAFGISLSIITMNIIK